MNTWTARYPDELAPIVEARACPSCHGFGYIETGVDRSGHGIGGGRCARCDGSGMVEVRIKQGVTETEVNDENALP